MMEPTAPKKFYLLPEEVRNALLGYLMQQKYADVARGVQMLEGLAEVPPPMPALAVVPDQGG